MIICDRDSKAQFCNREINGQGHHLHPHLKRYYTINTIINDYAQCLHTYLHLFNLKNALINLLSMHFRKEYSSGILTDKNERILIHLHMYI